MRPGFLVALILTVLFAASASAQGIIPMPGQGSGIVVIPGEGASPEVRAIAQAMERCHAKTQVAQMYVIFRRAEVSLEDARTVVAVTEAVVRQQVEAAKEAGIVDVEVEEGDLQWQRDILEAIYVIPIEDINDPAYMQEYGKQMLLTCMEEETPAPEPAEQQRMLPQAGA